MDTLEFYYLTRDQARATFVCPGGSTKRLSGAVAGANNGYVTISLGNSATFTSSAYNSYTLPNVPDGARDLFATHTDTAIVRRAVDYPNGSTIPLLDFASPEAVALQANTLTIDLNGVAGPEWHTELFTRGGTRALLSYSGPPCCANGKIYTLPASRQADGDLYRLEVGGGGRSVERFYATPSDEAMVFGPPANGATFTPVATQDQLWRAQIVARPEYPSQIRLVVTPPQPTTNTTSLVITASKEYFGGTPATWTFTVPDLSGVAGFPRGWTPMRVPGQSAVFVSEAPWLSSAATAHAGDTFRSAARWW